MTRELSHCPHCGVVLREKRSALHHRKFFAVLAEAYNQWPETDTTFTPDSAEHLRAFLLYKAGVKDSEIIEFGHTKSVNDYLADAMTKQFARERSKGVYVFINTVSNGVAIHRPRSIAWHNLDQKAFNDVSERVFAVIEKELGCSIEDLQSQVQVMA